MNSMKRIVIGLFSLVMVAHLTMANSDQNQATVDANEAEAADLLARFNAALNSVDPISAQQAVFRLNGVQGDVGPDATGREDRFDPLPFVVPPPLAGNINLNDCTPEDEPRECCKIPLPVKVINITTIKTLTCQKTRTETDITYNSRAPRCDLYHIFRRNFFQDCFEVQTRTVLFQDVCRVQEVIGKPEMQCCPTDRLTCCVGLIYLPPRIVTLRSGSNLFIKEQCATLEEFRMIVGMLEELSGITGSSGRN